MRSLSILALAVGGLLATATCYCDDSPPDKELPYPRPKDAALVETKGIFSVWTMKTGAADAYRVVVEIKLPEGRRVLSPRDLEGSKIAGSDGYGQLFARSRLRRPLIGVDGKVQLSDIVPITPGRPSKDTLTIKSKDLEEPLTFNLKAPD